MKCLNELINDFGLPSPFSFSCCNPSVIGGLRGLASLLMLLFNLLLQIVDHNY